MTFGIFVMQLFNGLSLFTILLLMALGLAIVFGLMGVINMAHGEIMAMGAYTTYLTAHFFERHLPGLMNIYLLVAILLAFVVGLLASNTLVAVVSAGGFIGAQRLRTVYVVVGAFAGAASLVIGLFFLAGAGADLPDLQQLIFGGR